MRQNLEYQKCADCQDGIGEIPISDEDGITYWICERCDVNMEWETIIVDGLKGEENGRKRN